MNRSVSVAIISFNTRELTCEAVRSLLRQTRGCPTEILVVDNASKDGSADEIAVRFSDVDLIRSDQNLGFAQANNLAAKRATGEWLLLLNPDTVVLDHAVETAMGLAESQTGEVIVGGRTFYGDGRLNPLSCHRRSSPWSLFCVASGLSGMFPGSEFFCPESYGSWRRDTVREVDAISGCFMLMRRSTWEKLGGFDPQFFMYGEETDLCLRAKKLGIRCIVCPDATIIHYGGASESLRAGKMLKLLSAKAKLARRHWRWPWNRIGPRWILLWPFTRVMAYRLLKVLRLRRAERLEPWAEIWSRRQEILIP
jgi:GT2 family glycosyltransferase